MTLCIEQGLPVDEKDNKGRTALMVASGTYNDPSKSLTALLEAGASLTITDERGWQAIHYAIDNRSTESCLLLLEHGYEVVAQPPPLAFRYPSLDAALAHVLDVFLCPLLDSGATIPPFRRSLRWTLASAAVVAKVEEWDWKIGKVATAEAATEAREKRVAKLKDDAWKRRRHLCLDRALWRKPAEPEPKK
jgi:ankyrin repeat protein